MIYEESNFGRYHGGRRTFVLCAFAHTIYIHAFCWSDVSFQLSQCDVRCRRAGARAPRQAIVDKTNNAEGFAQVPTAAAAVARLESNMYMACRERARDSRLSTSSALETRSTNCDRQQKRNGAEQKHVLEVNPLQTDAHTCDDNNNNTPISHREFNFKC